MAKTIEEAGELVWVSRDLGDGDLPLFYEWWGGAKPRITEIDGYWGARHGTQFLGKSEVQNFERHSNLRLKPGECVPVRMSFEIVGEPEGTPS